MLGSVCHVKVLGLDAIKVIKGLCEGLDVF